MTKQKLIQWKCDECDRILESQYPNQMRQWKEAHLLAHEIKRTNKREE